MDITNDSVVICLTGVPHYITDATITMLVSTFGISIGEVERRFYKGIDTGERFVRLKPRARTQIPDFVTVGGCKILIRVLSQDEVVQPFTLVQSSSMADESSGAGSMAAQGGQDYIGRGSSHTMPVGGSGGSNGKSRTKPGHCNGTVNSTSGIGSSSGSMSGSAMTTVAGGGSGGAGTGLLTNTFGTTGILSSTPRTELISTGCTGLNSTPLCQPDNASAALLSERDRDMDRDRPPQSHSPKIGKSLRSRLSTGSMLRSTSPMNPPEPTDDEIDLGTNTYLPGDSLDIPTLSPPPYKAPGSSSAGGSTSSILNGRHGGRGEGGGVHGGKGSENGDAKSSSSRTRDSATNGLAGAGSASSMMKKYGPSSRHGLHMPTKTDSSTSLTSSLAGKSTEALKDGSSNKKLCHGAGGVVFEEESCEDSEQDEKSHRRSKSTSKSILASKTVNGILRKGSGPGDELVPSTTEKHRDKKGRKGHHKHKSKSASRSLTRLEAVSESAGGERGEENGDGGGGGGGGGNDGKKDRDKGKGSSKHSRNNSTKSKEGKDKEKDNSSAKEAKHQKDLALTRDLPWCGCWGNGCL